VGVIESHLGISLVITPTTLRGHAQHKTGNAMNEILDTMCGWLFTYWFAFGILGLLKVAIIAGFIYLGFAIVMKYA
jgi:hypothetical protein